MTEIARDCISLQYQRSANIKLHIAFRSCISIPQHWPGVSCIYDILAAYKLPCKISHNLETLQETPCVYLSSYHFSF